jgi:hypothetical protein
VDGGVAVVSVHRKDVEALAVRRQIHRLIHAGNGDVRFRQRRGVPGLKASPATV